MQHTTLQYKHWSVSRSRTGLPRIRGGLMSELMDFYAQLNETIRARALAHGEYVRTACIRELADRLVLAEELTDWTLSVHQGRGSRRREHVVDAFSYDEVD